MSSVFSPVSFVIVTYNQEKYIQAAFESALRQEVFPIEIVVTDDHSSDQTFEIVKQIAKDYRGPHKIILNRNPKNLGIVSQINRAVSLSSGELIVGMAGDDISLPNRAARSYEEWCKSEKKAHSIFFNAAIIDSTGKKLGDQYIQDQQRIEGSDFQLTHNNGHKWRIQSYEKEDAIYNSWVLGATHAFSRETFNVFGELSKVLLAEDHAIPYRASILGSIKFINEIQVLYRRHEKNLSSSDFTKKNRQMEHANKILTSSQALKDLEIAVKKNILKNSQIKKLKEKCLKNMMSGLRDVLKDRDELNWKVIYFCCLENLKNIFKPSALRLIIKKMQK